MFSHVIGISKITKFARFWLYIYLLADIIRLHFKQNLSNESHDLNSYYYLQFYLCACYTWGYKQSYHIYIHHARFMVYIYTTACLYLFMHAHVFRIYWINSKTCNNFFFLLHVEILHLLCKHTYYKVKRYIRILIS